MAKFITIYSSNIPIDCHILKSRLETDGIPCFIYDENFIWVHPFKAVAIGGVKLKVPINKYEQSQKIINLVSQGKLIDETGEYPISEILSNEIDRQNEILSIKNKIRNEPSFVNELLETANEIIDLNEIEEILESEKEFQELTKKEFNFTWKQFLYELFDFDRSVFKYLRTRPVDYYLEKELVESFSNQKETKDITPCPNCDSDNTIFGYAIDFKWDVLYLLVSLLIWTPLYPIRKKFHCFDCGNDFKRQKTATAKQLGSR